MDHDYTRYLRDHNPTVRVLKLENAPLIISFLHLQFKQNNRTLISNMELMTNLSDYLFSLRERHGEDWYPGSARDYLTAWTNDGFLRKYYLAEGDEPVFELTPATEKVLDWIKDLDKKEFVGTESRLLKIFELLNEIVYKSSADPVQRLAELTRQKQELVHFVANESGSNSVVRDLMIHEYREKKARYLGLAGKLEK